jgi:predicted DNA-binding protein
MMKHRIRYTKKINVFINEDMFNKLKSICEKTKRTLSEIIREAIFDLIKKYEGR